ncbi:hypothetical protein M0746_026200 [Pseudomonas sp. P7]|nr:hypothetical protein [Pseudomonas sp. S11P7]
MSALFLLMSFTHPRKAPDVVDLNSLPAPVSFYEWVFLFCIVSFIPMLVVAFYYFVRAVTIFFRQRNLQVGLPVLLMFIVISAALYSFNHWVFSELF